MPDCLAQVFEAAMLLHPKVVSNSNVIRLTALFVAVSGCFTFEALQSMTSKICVCEFARGPGAPYAILVLDAIAGSRCLDNIPNCGAVLLMTHFYPLSWDKDRLATV